jgi:hypothetical protein
VRERFDAGTAVVALGAIVLLVSLFLNWYAPGYDAWAVFEWLDLLLAGVAIYALAVLAPRFAPLGRWLPLVCVGALVVVAVQLIDAPPAARGANLETGAWLALAATALMSLGALLAAASISVTVDVRGRERRRRAAAIDAREGAGPAGEVPDEPEDEPTVEEPPPSPPPPRGRRLFGVARDEDTEPDTQRTQALDPVDPDEERR